MHRLPITAHRGDIGSADSYPEGTIEALRAAAIKGADRVECDVRLSSSGTFHVMHDSTVDRTTSGTGAISGLSDASIAALNIDGGYGYNAGRHGTSLKVPTLSQVFTALKPYGAILHVQLNASSDPNATALATQVMSEFRPSQVILEVSTLTEAAAIKAVSPLLSVMVNNAVSGAASDSNVDWLSCERSTITSLSVVTALAPKRANAYISIADYGSDESTWMRNMFTWGAASFSTNNLDAALILRNNLLFDSPAQPIYQTINFVIDGGGAAILSGVKGDIQFDFDCTITANTLLADQSGSIIVNLWKDTYANYPPVVGDKITASAPPTLSSAAKAQDTTLTGWTVAVTAGDIIRVNVDADATAITRVTLALKVARYL